MLKRIYLLLFSAFLLCTQFLNAQVTTSSITGTVTDASGAGLAGATIVATHQPSGTRYTTVSQSNGQFNMVNMRVGGPYTVVISFVGYETEQFIDVYLRLGEAYIITSSLNRAAETMQEVVVTTTGRSNIINANRTGAVTNIGRAQIQNIPSISRSLNDLTRLTPQSSGTSIGGGNYRQNYITVDGSDFNNTFGIGSNLPAGGSPISLDALEEVSVNITPYDIRQSGFVGSAINAVTRSGTNNVNGSVYRYWRSEKQQGDKINGVEFTKPPFEFEQYGARLGGPIVKNKLFFFINYETENQPKQIQTRFAATSSAPFGSANNIARPTAQELLQISDYLSKTYGYETGPFDNYNTEIQRTKFLARLDWNINQKHRFNIRYNQVEGGEPSPPSTSRSPLTAFAPGATRQDQNALWFSNSRYFQGANFYSLAGELNSVLTNKLANTLRATYTYQNDSRETPSTPFPFVDIYKDGTPFTSFGYEPFSFGNLRKVTTYSVVDNLTLSLNNHNLTFGGQFDLSETINGFQRFGTSYYTFASWDDFVNGGKPLDFASTYSLAPGFAQAFPGFKFAQYSLYAQDEYSVSKNFRITTGLRVDIPTYPDVDEIKTHPLIADLSFAEGRKINTGNLPKSTPLWSPRIGFNWDVYGDRSFQVRGGTGIFSGRVPFVWIVSQSGDAGLLQVTQTFETPAADRNNPANYVTPGPFNPDPTAYRPATQPPAGTVIPSTISAMSEDFKFPQTWKTSVGIDKRLPIGIIATLDAIFNKDLNTAVFTNPNLVNPQPLNIAGYPDNRLVYPGTVRDRFINPLTAANAAVNPSTPVPNGDTRGTQAFNTIVLDNGSKGYYFSLTGKLEKQLTRGFGGMIAYTLTTAANLFDGGGDQPLSAWQGTANVNGSNFAKLGNAGFTVPHRFIGAVSYRKEYLRHLATTISLTYEGAHQGRFSYVYSTDFNRDGTNNDLIYIPRNPSEISFGTSNSTINGVTYTPQQQSDMFFSYIEQDKYLKKRKGQYAERNGALLPWRNEWGFRVLQDVFTNVGGKRNTIQFSLDILNFANLLNNDWGAVRTVSNQSILQPQGSVTIGGTTKPTFRLANDRFAPGAVTESFKDVVSISSTYYMQFGLRYLFGQ